MGALGSLLWFCLSRKPGTQVENRYRQIITNLLTEGAGWGLLLGAGEGMGGIARYGQVGAGVSALRPDGGGWSRLGSMGSGNAIFWSYCFDILNR